MSRLSPDRIVSHYDLLGVSQAATADEIVDAEVALRKLYEARSKQGDATATDVLRRLNEAYAVLSDEHKRADYDRDPHVLAASYVDVAYSLPIGRYAKLEAVAGWLAETVGADAVRPVAIDDVLRPDPLLDGAAAGGGRR